MVFKIGSSRIGDRCRECESLEDVTCDKCTKERNDRYIRSLKESVAASILPTCLGESFWGDPDDWEPEESLFMKYMEDNDE